MRKAQEVVFLELLADLLDDGVALAKAVSVACDSKRARWFGTSFRQVAHEVCAAVVRGISLDRALALQPRHFSAEVACRAGKDPREAAQLLHLTHLARDAGRGWMQLKFCLLCWLLAVILICQAYVPAMREIYVGLGAVLPAPADLVLRTHGGLMLLFAVLIGLLVISWTPRVVALWGCNCAGCLDRWKQELEREDRFLGRLVPCVIISMVCHGGFVMIALMLPLLSGWS